MKNGFDTGMASDEWYLTYHGFDPGDEKLRETLTAVGNGYLGTRGAYECECSSYYFYPGTYIAGVFNKTPSSVQGREILNNDFVNCPNWLPVEFKIGSGGFTSPLSMEILSYSHRLNMREGIMERLMVVRIRWTSHPHILAPYGVHGRPASLCASIRFHTTQLFRPYHFPFLHGR